MIISNSRVYDIFLGGYPGTKKRGIGGAGLGGLEGFRGEEAHSEARKFKEFDRKIRENCKFKAIFEKFDSSFAQIFSQKLSK